MNREIKLQINKKLRITHLCFNQTSIIHILPQLFICVENVGYVCPSMDYHSCAPVFRVQFIFVTFSIGIQIWKVVE